MPATDSVANGVTRSTSIGGNTYTLRLLTTSEGVLPLARITQIAGPSIVALIDEVAKKKGDIMSVNVEELLAGVLREALKNFTAEDFPYFAGLFLPCTKVAFAGGKEVPLADVYDLHFAGKYGQWMQWIGWCLKENFGDVFLGDHGLAGAAASLQAAKVGASQGSQSPDT